MHKLAHGSAFASRLLRAGEQLAATGRAAHPGAVVRQPVGRSARAFSHRIVGGSLSLEQRRAFVHTEAAAHAAPAAAAATSPASVSNGSPDGLTSLMANPPPSIRSVIVKLLQTLSSKKEVDHYLRLYGTPASEAAGNNFAVIKVGGGLIRDELEQLVSSLAFLVDVGLIPVVIHGAGPQLNAKLESRGIVSDYHGGIRVTTPEILSVARQTFAEENIKLLEALENRGVRCRGFVGGVFTADLLDEKKFGLVGEVKEVNATQIRAQIAKGVVPVITCAAESATGQVLNVNADVAAHMLAKTLQPVKVVYLSQNGGLRDDAGRMMSAIDVGSDYERLMNEEWFTKGNRLKLKEIKQLLDALPPSASVSITSAEQLPRELFTHKGSGTLVKRTERFIHHKSLDTVDEARLTKLLESSFAGKLAPDYMDDLRANLAGLYISENYSAVAVVTHLRVAGMEEGVAYLDKFAVDPASQGTGAAQKLWDQLVANHKTLVWRSRKENPINSWYCDHSEGCWTPPGSPWTCFFIGVKDLTTATRAIDAVLAKRANLNREPNAAVTNPGEGAMRGFASWARSTNSASTPKGSRGFATSARKQRVGIVGARGYTGGELIQLLARHPSLELVSANSRAVVGHTVEQVVPELAKAENKDCAWRSLKFGNLQPSELHTAEADVWIMALPNGIAKPYVDALQAGTKSKIVDLSADYRFDSAWTYGLPEAKGNRALLAGASYVANPGCYATAMQLALLPFLPLMAPGSAPSAFGVSGYSGAGTTPSRKNDPEALRDNLMPYALGGHIHEREVVSQLRRVSSEFGDMQFVPHVAPWFRGITMTVTATLKEKHTDAQLRELLAAYYAGEPLVQVAAAGTIPEVREIAGRCGAIVSAYSSPTAERPGRIVLCAVVDNLLKGAASQCLQNINLVCGFEETLAIPTMAQTKA